MATLKMEKFWNYYQSAWLSVCDDVSTSLRQNGFAPKGADGKFEIGNSHGEVYFYPASGSALADRLSMVAIYPTPTGNLLIKFTCFDRKQLVLLDRHIQQKLTTMTSGKTQQNASGHFAREYYFYRNAQPADPVDMGSKLLEAVRVWIAALNAFTEEGEIVR